MQKEFIELDESGDFVSCICGNTPTGQGFFTCDETGKEVYPTGDGPWDGIKYVCAECGRIIDQNTGEVIGHGKYEPLV
jgi:hypothetical protein